MTREPPLNWVGVTFASSAPGIVSKTSLATLSPSWTKHAPMIVSSAAIEVEEAVATRRSAMPSDDRDDRRGEERQARRPEGQATRTTGAGLTGVPRSAESASK